MTETDTAIFFLPFATCLFWLCLNPLIQSRDIALRNIQLLLAALCISSFAMARTACIRYTGISLCPFFIRQFFTPLIIPLAILYIRSIGPLNRADKHLLMGITVPALLLFAELILMTVTGPDEFKAYLYGISGLSYHSQDHRIWIYLQLCSVWIYYLILAVEISLFAASVIKKARRGNVHIQEYNILLCATAYGIADVSAAMAQTVPSWVMITSSILLSAMIFTVSYTGLFHNRQDVTLSRLIKGVGGVFPKEDNISKIRAAIISQSSITIKDQGTVNKAIPKESKADNADTQLSQADEESLRIRFEELIVNDRLFLKQGIRISDIASMLQTNRTYVSRLVNNTYDMSFSDYINTLRIDYAQQHLLLNRDARQSDIAAACGFPNASAFNNVFKKQTGVTPKIWVATHMSTFNRTDRLSD